MNTVTLPPKPSASRNTRISSDSVWPLRRADGRTWAEAHSAAHGFQLEVDTSLANR